MDTRSGNAVKPSRYNFRVGVADGAFVLFNSATGAMLSIPDVLSEEVNALLHTSSFDTGLPDGSPEGSALLLRGGFLVSRDKDELAEVIERFQSDDTDGRLDITLCTTLACNLQCRYCYQSRQSGRMSAATAKSVASTIRQKLKQGGYRELEVSWFGGEPLLAPDLIDSLSAELITASDRQGVNYSGSLVTNGTLVPSDLAAFLARNRIVDAQITLDGLAETHNANRPFKNGAPSFHQVAEGIRRFSDLIPVSLRINVDAEGSQTWNALIDLLEKEGLFEEQREVSPYIAPVAPLSNHCASACDSAFTSEAFFGHLLEFQKALLKRRPNIYLNKIMEIPRPLSKACGAQSQHALTFHPSGTIYKCGLEVHEADKTAGSVTVQFEKHANYLKWTRQSPFEKQDCRECVFLPVCMGGCPKYNFREGYAHHREACIYWQKHFPKVVPILAEYRDRLS